MSIDKKKKWLFWGALPNMLIPAFYILFEIYTSESLIGTRALLFVVIVSASTVVSFVSIFKIAGWHKMLPVLSAVIGCILLFWFLFTVAFFYG